VLVAHNARFDYGFLKNAFKAEGLAFHLPLLCTIKLFKQFYPHLPNYNLDALTQIFSIPTPNAHRAQGDVATLYGLVSRLVCDFPIATVLTCAQALYKTPSHPSHLITNLKSLPDSPGVYLFYGAKSDLPLYIGKSINLRQRVLSHFQADHTHAKEFKLAQQVVSVEVRPTAGELSALLLESTLIKEKMPLFNRRLRRKKQVVRFVVQEKTGYLTVSLERGLVDEDELGERRERYGAFSSLTSAKRTLLDLVKTYTLCTKLCELEPARGACFAYQLKRCKGACLSEEPAPLYNERVKEALAQFKQDIWPFKGAIAIKEQNVPNQLTQILVFDQWRHVGSVPDEASLTSLKKKTASSELDTYKILRQFLKTIVRQHQVMDLSVE